MADYGSEAAQLAADYGWSVALLNSDPELKALFDTAVSNGFTPARFTASLRDTNWFKTHQESWRTTEILRITDPQEWEARNTARTAELRDLAAGMGGITSDHDLSYLAENSLRFGWNDSTIRDALAAYVHTRTSGTLAGQYIGSAGANFTELTKTARRNGYTLPTGQINSWLTEIARGDATVEDYGQFIRRQAAAMYPAWSDELMAGTDLEDLVSPYKQTMARLLEVPPESVTFDDRLLKGAMGQRQKTAAGANAPGNKYEVMSLYDFEDQVRKDARWQYTDNAHKDVLGAGNDVLQLMGFK